MRSLLFEAANTLMTRVNKDSAVSRWGLSLMARSGAKKAKVAVAPDARGDPSLHLDGRHNLQSSTLSKIYRSRPEEDVGRIIPKLLEANRTIA